MKVPRLSAGNAAVIELREWIAAERAAVWLKLAGETDPTAILSGRGIFQKERESRSPPFPGYRCRE